MDDLLLSRGGNDLIAIELAPFGYGIATRFPYSGRGDLLRRDIEGNAA
jgi:hypothetical protein